MNMTLLVNPWERAARIVEAHAFAAGDVATVTVNGVQGADPASLQLRLFRDATMRQPVAAAGTFEPLPGRRDAFSASLPLDSSDMLDWFDDSVSESSGDDDEDVVRLLRLTPEDRAERAVRTDGWLVVADSSRVWVACRVPVILRAFPGLGRVPADSWSAVVRAAVLEASTQADWEESSEGSPAFIKNKPAPVQADWEESSEGSPAFIKNKPTIPAPVLVDATLTRQGAAADAKAVGDALRGGFTEWEFSGVPSGLSVASIEYNSSSACWKITLSSGEYGLYNGFADRVELLTTDITGGSDGFPGGISATRRLITPTKTSQLANDGAPNGGGTPYATTAQIPDVTGKADKVLSAAAGNLASLDASGNLVDSGATPASIKAAAVAAVVNGADATMDTLKEIADIIGSNQAAGSVLKRILDLESGKVNKEAGKGLVAVDAALATSGAAADAKAVGDALRGGFTAWEFSGNVSPGMTYTVDITEYEGPVYIASLFGSDETSETTFETVGVDSLDVVRILFVITGITATRHLITPTKTSQLANDGAPNGGGTPYATTEQVAAKQDALSAAQLANIAAVPNKANASDVNAALALKASLSDLPYAMVTPGEWEFSGSGYDASKTYRVRFSEISDSLYAFVEVYDPVNDLWEITAPPLTDVSGTELSLSWDDGYVTATRASLPGHLCDRAGNLVVVTGATELTLPAANPGYLRDFLVRLEISGSTVPTITFAAPTGETITYETDGDEFPVPDEAGDWLYSFTESCVAHKFAVALKKVNTVAAPQAQGGA